MEYLEDTNLRLSFFNSIFEILVGFNFTYVGFEIVNQFINSYLIRTARKQYRFVKLTFTASSFGPLVSNSFTVTATAQNEISLLLAKINRILTDYKNFYSIRYLRVKSRIKFTPIFIYCGFYGFFVLFLSGLSESDRSIVFENNLTYFQVEGVYSMRNCAFVVLLIFNTCSILFLLFLFFRDWKKRGLARNLNFASTRLLIVRATQFFCLSILLSAVLCVFLGIQPTNSLLFQLIVLLTSILISLFPVLSLTFWAYPGHRIKFSVTDDINQSIYFKIHSIASPFLPSANKYSEYEKATDNENYLKWLYCWKFLEFYWLRLLTIILILGAIIFSSYHLLKPKDKELMTFIRSAVYREFQAYKSLPKIDTAYFDKYYTKDGEARRQVLYHMHLHKERNEILSNPGNFSSVEFIEGRVLQISEERILVETHESWSTRWYNAKQKRYTYKYTDTSKQPQLYVLKREQGIWLIDKNNYMENVSQVE